MNLIENIVKEIPQGNAYCEVFSDGSSVFWEKEPHPVEVINDWTDAIVYFFRVLQDRERYIKVRGVVEDTVLTKETLAAAAKTMQKRLEDYTDEQATAFFLLKNMKFMGKTPIWDDGFYRKEFRVNNKNLMKLREVLPYWHCRLLMPQIDSKNPIKFMEYWDRDDSVFYVDPYWVTGIRFGYKRLADKHHKKVLECVQERVGKVVLVAPEDSMYSELPWENIEVGRDRSRKMRLWRNFKKQKSLFD